MNDCSKLIMLWVVKKGKGNINFGGRLILLLDKKFVTSFQKHFTLEVKNVIWNNSSQFITREKFSSEKFGVSFVYSLYRWCYFIRKLYYEEKLVSFFSSLILKDFLLSLAVYYTLFFMFSAHASSWEISCIILWKILQKLCLLTV